MPTPKYYPLKQSPLFKTESRKRLALEIFGMDLVALEHLAGRTDNYRTFSINQGAKVRSVEVPKGRLERIHKRLFELLQRIEKPAYLHSGVRKRSYITNAGAHVGTVPVVKLDIKKFYPAIDGGRVYRFFKEQMACSPDVAGLLMRLCVVDNHVPTGSSVSQLLAFFAAKPMFDELHALAKKHGLCYTCYVDDLTWSGRRATSSFLWKAKQVVHRHGFAHHKDRCFAANDRKLVTGVLINGHDLTVLPSKELELWERFRALADIEPLDRIAALDSLIGSASAAGQIEKRFLARLKGLRQLKALATAGLSASIA